MGRPHSRRVEPRRRRTRWRTTRSASWCGSQTRAPERASVRRRTLAAPNDLEICFSNHSGLSFTESGFLSQSLPTSAATSLDYFRLTSPCRADHFDGGFTARVTVAGGLDRAAVGLLQGISIRGRVFLRELDSTDSDLKQLGGCLVIRTAAQRFFRFRHCLPDLGGFDLFGGSVRFRRLRHPIGAWRAVHRSARRLLRFSAASTEQEAAHQRTDAHPPSL